MHIWRELNIQIVFTEFSVTLKISCTDFIKKKKKKKTQELRTQIQLFPLLFCLILSKLTCCGTISTDTMERHLSNRAWKTIIEHIQRCFLFNAPFSLCHADFFMVTKSPRRASFCESASQLMRNNDPITLPQSRACQVVFGTTGISPGFCAGEQIHIA